MAIRQVRIGSMNNIHQYDDADFNSAIETDQPIKAGTPVDPDDVLRLDDIGTSIGDIFGPAISVDANIVEFDGITGKKIKDGGLSHTNVADAISKKHTQGTDTALGAVGTKNPPIDADKLIYRDSTSSDALVTSTWTQVKAFLKTYFDTIYALASHAISSHSDTSLAGISNNDLMQWNDSSSKWLPKSIAEVISGNNISPGGVGVSGATAGTGGVAFPAVAVAMADANTLDDYEEGTWTPGLKFGGNSNLMAGTFAGIYTKIGSIVTIIGYISLTEAGDSTGNATITGLPFASSITSGHYPPVLIYFTRVSFANQYQGVINNTTIIALNEIVEAGTVTALTESNFADNSVIVFSMTYSII